jgi:hypothetical protein
VIITFGITSASTKAYFIEGLVNYNLDLILHLQGHVVHLVSVLHNGTLSDVWVAMQVAYPSYVTNELCRTNGG